MLGLGGALDPADDNLGVWAGRYLDLAVTGVRSAEVAGKIARHVGRFHAWFAEGFGHDRISAVTAREVTAWRDHLEAAGQTDRDGSAVSMAPATVNNHLAHLSATCCPHSGQVRTEASASWWPDTVLTVMPCAAPCCARATCCSRLRTATDAGGAGLVGRGRRREH